MQENANPESRKSFCLLNPEYWNFDGRIRDPRLWNPESTAYNPESRTVLYSLTWGNKVMRSPHMPGRRNWNSLMTLFIWAAVLVMKMALGGDINKVMP